MTIRTDEEKILGLVPEHEAGRNDWSFLLAARDTAPTACAAIMSVFFPIAGAATMIGAEFYKNLAVQRGLNRANWIAQDLIVEHNRTTDWFAERDADLFVELRDIGNKCVNEPFERKFRYFVELLQGKMTEGQALAKDKYYRFKRWVELLDLISLRSISRFKTSDAELPKYSSKANNSVKFYSQGGAGSGLATVTNLDFCHSLVKGEKTSLWEFISQLESIGLLFFDRGGGASTPNDAATCLWHRDTEGFAGYLRKADRTRRLSEEDSSEDSE